MWGFILFKFNLTNRGRAAKSRYCHVVQSYLAIFLCIRASEQRVEDDDGLIQIPDEHPLQNTKTEPYIRCVLATPQL